jgi:chromosomal replication initiation ATPase DnaA
MSIRAACWKQLVDLSIYDEMRQSVEEFLHEIGETFGGRDHGTVLHACRTVFVRMKKEVKSARRL